MDLATTNAVTDKDDLERTSRIFGGLTPDDLLPSPIELGAIEDYMLASAKSSIKLSEMQPPTANVPLNNQKLTGVGTPTANTDAATKNYVDTHTIDGGDF